MRSRPKKANFNRRMLQSLPVPDEKAALCYDVNTRGLGVKVEPSGSSTFFWTRRGGPRVFWLTIGPLEDVTLESARERASSYNSDIAKWKQGGMVGQPSFVKSSSPSFGEILEAYRDRHLTTTKNPDRVIAEFDSTMRAHVNGLRDRRLDQITKADIVALHEVVHKKHSPYVANRLLQAIRAAINWAIDKAAIWSGTNPAARIELFPEKTRRRFLLGNEFGALKAALDSPDTPADLKDFVRLSLFTGQRRGDVLSMAWRDIDMQRCVWLVPSPKNEQPFYVPLTVEAAQVLKDRLKQANARAAKDGLEPSGWVFPSHSACGHLKDLKRSWGELREAAGLAGLRVHDLRRTFGSVQAEAGSSLHVIGASLGHRSTEATQIYAQLQLESVRRSAQNATSTMATAMKRKPQKQRALPPVPAAVKRRKA